MVFREKCAFNRLAFVLLFVLMLSGQAVLHAQTLQPVGELLAAGGQVRSVVYNQGYAYVLSRDSTLRVFDLVDLETSTSFYSDDQPVHSVQVQGNEVMESSGGYLYIAGIEVLSVYDISTPDNPVEVDLEGEGLRDFENLVVHGNYLFGLGRGGFSLYDITTKSNPVFINSYATSKKSETTVAGAVSGAYLYVSEAGPGWPNPNQQDWETVVFDFSAPPALTVVNRVSRDQIGLHLRAINGQLLECGSTHVGLLGLDAPLQPLVIDGRNASAAVCDLLGARLVTHGAVFELEPDMLTVVDQFDAGNTLAEAIPYGSDVSGSHVFLAQDSRVLILGEPVQLLPQASLSTTSVNYGSTAVGSAAMQAVTLTNTGLADLDVSALQLEGADAAFFSITAGSAPATLAPGASMDIVVSFAPLDTRAYQANLKITDNAEGSPRSVALQGAGVAPALMLSTNSIVFPDTEVASSTRQSVFITNAGSSTIDLVSMSIVPSQQAGKLLSGPESFAVDSGGAAGALAPGGSREVVIAFTPSASGLHTADLEITSSDAGSPHRVSLEGTGIEPVLQLTQTEIQFPPTSVGAQQAAPLQLSNVGTAPLTIDSIVVAPPGNSVFSVLEGSGAGVIAPGGVRNLLIAFSPIDEIAYTGELSIASDAAGSPHLVALSGEGTMPGMTVSPIAIRFEDTPVGEFVEASAMAQNTGSETVTISSIQITGEQGSAFEIVSGAETGAFSPGATRTIGLRFTPPSAGEFSAVLSVETDSPQSPYEVALSGKGTEAGVAIAPQTLEFADTPVGGESAGTITVTNTGNVPVTMSMATITQGGVAYSIVSGGNEGVILAGASRSIGISFQPPSTGEFTGQLEITTTASETPVVVDLSGNGVDIALNVTPASLSFPAVSIDESAELQATLSNNGGSDFFIDRIEIRGADAPAFAVISGGQAGVISPGSARVVTVRFQPVKLGANMAEAPVVQSNGAELSIPLAGIGALSAADPILEEPEEGLDVGIEVKKPEPFAAIETTLYYRRGGEATFQQVSMDVGDSTVIGTIPGDYATLRGVDYYVRMFDGVDEFTYPATNPAEMPAHIQIHTPPFRPPITLEAERHSMISTPLLLNEPSAAAVLRDDYGAYDRRDWRLHRWNAASQSYEEFSGDEVLEPGAAFWLITRTGESFDVEEGLSVSTVSPFSLALEPGWNQIASPFPFAVSWENSFSTQVPSDIGLLEPPVFYDGASYEYDQTVLEPWKGYFVYNRKTEPVHVSVRPVEWTQAGAGKSPAVEGPTFALRLEAVLPSMGLRDVDNILGIHPEARSGEDRLDRRDAPGFGDFLRVNVIEGDTALAHSYRPPSERGIFWDVEYEARVPTDLFKTQKEVKVALHPDGDMPDGFEIYVLDRDESRAIPIDNGQFSLWLQSSDPVRRVRIIVGTQAFAEEHREDIPLKPIPDELAVGYPNPFSSLTKISYQVGKPQRVRIDVYNLLGQHISTLVDAEAKAGAYVTTWDGRDDAGRPAASGVYLYRMRTGDFEATRKIVLLR